MDYGNHPGDELNNGEYFEDGGYSGGDVGESLRAFGSTYRTASWGATVLKYSTLILVLLALLAVIQAFISIEAVKSYSKAITTFGWIGSIGFITGLVLRFFEKRQGVIASSYEGLPVSL